jgi:hypothetical protein
MSKVNLFKRSIYGRTEWRPWVWVVGVIFAITLVIGGIVFATVKGSEASCNNAWEQPTRHNAFGGCRVEIEPGVWLPEHKVNKADIQVTVR